MERLRDEKEKLSERLRREGAFDLQTILDDCDQEIFLRCSECEGRSRGYTRCKKRWCPICARSIAAERVAKYERAVEKLNWPLHVTFTIANTPTINSSDLRQLLHSFRKLRQRRLWKLCVRGGWVSLEITNRGRGWHPHLHVLADCEWLSLSTCPPTKRDTRERKKWKCEQAARELGDTWAEIVGQRTASVAIRRRSGGNIAKEVFKYSVKPGDLLKCKSRAADLIRAMARCRLFRGFGKCYKLKLDEREKRKCTCELCGEHCSKIPETVLEEMRLKSFANRRAPRSLKAA